MRYRYQDFPEQAEPIYDFYIADGAGLRVRRYHRYDVETGTFGRKTYRIHTGANIVIKRQDQMDRVLANHVFTLGYDPEKVLDAMLRRAEETAAQASAMLRQAEDRKLAVERARGKAIVEETYGTIVEQKPKRAWVPTDGQAGR